MTWSADSKGKATLFITLLSALEHVIVISLSLISSQELIDSGMNLPLLKYIGKINFISDISFQELFDHHIFYWHEVPWYMLGGLFVCLAVKRSPSKSKGD